MTGMAKDLFSKKSQAEQRAELRSASYWAEQNEINENMLRLKAERVARKAEAAIALPGPDGQGATKPRKKRIIRS